jgi:hypothetical protein
MSPVPASSKILVKINMDKENAQQISWKEF